MNRIALTGLAAAAVLALAPAARGEFVSETFGGKAAARPGTMTVQAVDGVGTVLNFDLSAVPKDAAVYRALLKVTCARRGYQQPVVFHPLVSKAGKVEKADKPLDLRGPFYQDFDATELVRAWVKDPAANAGLLAASVPGWDREKTLLVVSYDGKPRPGPVPAVAGLKAVYHSGQVFVRWREIEDVIAAEEIKFGDFEPKVLAAEQKRSILYRVYRHTKPITPQTIGQAELVREVEEILPAYNLDAVPTTEFPGQNSRPSRLPIGGNRRTDVIVKRCLLPEGQEPLASGENLAVMTCRQEGSFHYAVTAMVDGFEAAGALAAGSSLAQPVAEKVAAIAPVPQQKPDRTRAPKQDVVESYVCFYEPPYWPTPLRVEMCTAYAPETAEKDKVPLEICTGTYGGQAPYNLGRRHVPGAYYIAPAVVSGMGQGIHECIGTLKSYDQGVVRNYFHLQIFALIDWARQKWPNIDPQRVVINGQFAIWALRHGDKFAVVIADPYGNYSAGIEMQKWGWAWGPYPRASRNEDGDVDQWEYLNVAKWIREHPTVELPFYCGKASSASHVGDMGFMPAPEVYRAMLDTKRAFAAHFGASQGFGGPPPAAAFPIRRDQAVPAFTHCSLDDMVGDGDQWGGAAGGTIGSGDPWGRFNADLRWSFDDITDEAAKFQVTLWLDAGARSDACTVDLTPRRCRTFKPRPGQKFSWSVVPVEAEGKPQSGESAADANGLVTAEKVIVGKNKVRLSIAKE